MCNFQSFIHNPHIFSSKHEHIEWSACGVTVEIMDEQGRECATEVRINDNKDGSY